MRPHLGYGNIINDQLNNEHFIHLSNTRFLEYVATFYRWWFEVLVFSSKILEQNNLDMKIRKFSTMLTFRNSLLKIGQPAPKPVYNIHNPTCLKLLSRLRLGLSHLNEHKFYHSFKGCVNPLCSWALRLISFLISFCTFVVSLIFEKSCE